MLQYHTFMFIFRVNRVNKLDPLTNLIIRGKRTAGRLVVAQSTDKNHQNLLPPASLGRASLGKPEKGGRGRGKTFPNRVVVPHWHWPDLAKSLTPPFLAPWLSKQAPRFHFQPMDTQFDRVAMDHTPPEKVRGMKTLDKSAFEKTVQIPGLKVPMSSIREVSKVLKKSLFHAPGIKSVAQLPAADPDHDKSRLFLLDPDKYPDVGSVSEEEKELFQRLDVDLGSWKLYDLPMTYNNWTFSEILKMVLPKESESVGGYSQIGHIIHLNLREELLEYKGIIGQVLLDKVPTAKTVVNKTNTIDNTYRNFQMEVLAGEPNLLTTAREHGCSFYMDFSKVYWNSRLSTEHKRIIDQVNKGDVLYDVFAGVGPFAIPVAKKKGTVVHANDLNPESYRWLQHNVKLNKITGGIHTYNMDGRDFIRQTVKKDLLARWQCSDQLEHSDSDYKIHIVMNLPALAVEFLDAFPGLLADVDPGSFRQRVVLPMVHCYCFSKADDPVQDAKDMAARALGMLLPTDCQVRNVRNVAPGKEMMCIMFELQQQVLTGGGVVLDTTTSSNNAVQELVGVGEVQQQQVEGGSPPGKKFKEDCS